MKQINHFVLALFVILILLGVFSTSVFATGAPPASRVKIWCMARIIGCDYVKIFNDTNGNGQLDTGESFTNFSSSIAAISINGPRSYPNVSLPSSGDTKIALPAGTYTFTIATQGTWQGTSYNHDGIQGSYTGSAPNVTGTFTLGGGLTQIYFGIRPSLPNLAPASLSVSNPTPTVGNSVTFLGYVYNQGAGNGTVATTARFCIDNASCASSTTGTLGEFVSASLGAGASSAQLTSNTWTATLGSHTIYLCVDVLNQETESNETDNCSNVPFAAAAAAAPQLVVQGSVVAKNGLYLTRATSNLSQPSEIFQERPDFLVTILSPVMDTLIRQVLTRSAYSWQEVAP